MFGKSKKREKVRNSSTRKSSTRGRKASDSTQTLTRGIVMVSICSGACLWGYALINLATRTS